MSNQRSELHDLITFIQEMLENVPEEIERGSRDDLSGPGGRISRIIYQSTLTNIKVPEKEIVVIFDLREPKEAASLERHKSAFPPSYLQVEIIAHLAIVYIYPGGASKVTTRQRTLRRFKGYARHSRSPPRPPL